MTTGPVTYDQFIAAKVAAAPSKGVALPLAVSDVLFPFQRDMVGWAVKKGCAAIFASYGLGKTPVQLEIARQVLAAAGGRFLLVAPLGVHTEFRRDAAMLGVPLPTIRATAEASATGVYLTHYEAVRDGRVDPRTFTGAALDEADCFPAGTPVETPRGFVPIEQIRIGDAIINASGVDHVRDTFRREVRRAVRITVGERSVISSDNHRYFTGRGWIAAADLRPGDAIMEAAAAVRFLREGDRAGDLPAGTEAVLRRILLREMAGGAAGRLGADGSGEAGESDATGPDREVAPAADLRALRRDVLPQDRLGHEAPVLQQPLLGEVADVPAASQAADRAGLPHADGARETHCQSAGVLGVGLAGGGGWQGAARGVELDGRSRRASEGRGDPSRAWGPSAVGRGQGAWADGAATPALRGAGRDAVGDGARGARESATRGPTELPLSRPGAPVGEARDRGGRGVAPSARDAGGGRAESGVPAFARVDRVEVLECGHPALDRFRDADGKLRFYDLTATRHPSFSVAGLLAHNCLRGMGGTKLFREFMRLFEGVRFKFVLTATPSPNELIELLAYAAFLGVMEIGEAKTRWFKRNSEKADELTLHAHKEREFWLWVATWALFITRPSDLDPSYDDSRYVLPALRVHWHELPTDHADAGEERDGQRRLVKDSALGVVSAAREKRASLERRVAAVVERVAALRGPDGALADQAVVWCDLNDEQRALEKGLAAAGLRVSSLDGRHDLDAREAAIGAWRARETDVFLSKPVMFGAGVNLQQCHSMVFAGIGFKAREVMQAVHRIHRFLQAHACDVHFYYTDAEREVRRTLEAKWREHDALVARMAAIVREYGLARSGMDEELRRASDVTRAEAAGAAWRVVHNDTVRETAAMPAASVQLVVTSVPFGTQYEYTASYLDFGHTDSNAHFWAQMDYLTPELLRVLEPGRIAVVHVKDRIVPGGLTGLGFQTVYPFHCDAIAHFQRHGFAYLGLVTVVTDVVRENNQTYRLGYSEQCKDGSRMGVGMPEYLIVLRKPQTDRTKGYADRPVVKAKADYSLGRWQVDAHGFHRSGGNRLLTADDLRGLEHHQMFKLFRAHQATHVYDYEAHVALNDALAARGELPTDFMLLQPPSWSPDVWTDVARMRTLNGAQSAKGREAHLCPLQLDIVDRAIIQYSNPGDVVYDPFCGLGTVPMRAVALKRRGLGVELNERYFRDAIYYCRAAERELSTPTLFDLDAPPVGNDNAGASNDTAIAAAGDAE